MPRRVFPFALTACLTACAALTGCAAGGSGGVGLPAYEFEQAYAVGLDVAAAERCGDTVDAGLVRYNLVENAKRRGQPDAIAEKAGRAFDKTKAEYTRRLAKTPEFCVSQYNVSSETLALYQKGEFSRPR
jgi:hypothetical protein